MERTLRVVRHWGAPAAAAIFFVLWCVAEAGRMGPWPGLPYWPGTAPLLLTTAAIALAGWKPYVSLAFSAALLLGQLAHLIPPMASNHWAIYLGSSIALAFIMWTGNKRQRIWAAGATILFAAFARACSSWPSPMNIDCSARGSKTAAVSERGRPPSSLMQGSYIALRVVVSSIASLPSQTPSPIMAKPRTKCSQLSAVLNGTKLAPVPWLMTRP